MNFTNFVEHETAPAFVLFGNLLVVVAAAKLRVHWSVVWLILNRQFSFVLTSRLRTD
eukprot:m.362701 g.362701  ORF g.362701 m.362701 type:complete len:57 (-) comp20779_c0_seq1:847-1017(-)